MAQYTVVFERKNCTGIAACSIVAKGLWKMAEDDKAVLVGAQEKGADVWELDVDEKQLGGHIEAARHCPVRVIKILDKSGKEMHVDYV